VLVVHMWLLPALLLLLGRRWVVPVLAPYCCRPLLLRVLLGLRVVSSHRVSPVSPLLLLLLLLRGCPMSCPLLLLRCHSGRVEGHARCHPLLLRLLTWRLPTAPSSHHRHCRGVHLPLEDGLG
jgi:hypothetical protein